MKVVTWIWVVICFVACSKGEEPKSESMPVSFYRAADMSFLPTIEKSGLPYKNNNKTEDPLITLQKAGCNTIRLRLWHSPSGSGSGFEEVKAFAERIRKTGMKIWLSVHYSDTWADPGRQNKPEAWKNMDFSSLKSELKEYTDNIILGIKPDIIQIGNETNDGMLWPEGRLSQNEAQYVELLHDVCETIRSRNSQTKIMLHYAGINGAQWYFSKVAGADFDYIGISYYPLWHGKNLDAFRTGLETLGQATQKKIIIAETAYPFTLGWNDWTNNIVGLPEQLVPGFEATKEGQKNFLATIRNIIDESPHGKGFCYWGTEWVAFRGKESTNGSSWENQALWDFTNNALPALEAFKPN